MIQKLRSRVPVDLNQKSFKINDSNIHYCVTSYLHNKGKLPPALDGIQIGQWDVKGVTDMKFLFSGCVDFNENINDWDVSSVKNMESTFFLCKKFNQPLDKWIVSNIDNMNSMFADCHQFNQPLNKWIVSEAKDMESMFSCCYEYNNFDQPLNGWNVSSVIKMGYMFYNCAKFNLPLIGWQVNNVRDMRSMFSGCTSFDQQLDGPHKWDVRNVENFTEMFSKGCPIRFTATADNDLWKLDKATNDGMEDMFDDNRWPIHFRRMSDLLLQRTNEEDEEDEEEYDQNEAIEIHKAMGKIDHTRLINHLKNSLTDATITVVRKGNQFNYANYIKTSFMSIIPSDDEKNRSDLDHIMSSRLTDLNYNMVSDLLLDALYFSMEYVKLQPTPFQKSYVDAYLHDCLNAYINGKTNETKMTCAKGGLERIVTTLQAPCTECVSMFEYENNDVKNGKKEEEYKFILALITTSYPGIMINEYIKEWYVLHSDKGHPDFIQLSEEDKRESLHKFVLGKYRDEDLTDEVTRIIGERVLQHGVLDLSEGAFSYTGGRRSRRKKRKKRNTKTITKNKKKITKKKKRIMKKKQTRR